MFVHLRETYERSENKKKYAYIKGLRNKGYEPIAAKIKDGMTEKDAYNFETHLIKQYGRLDIDPGGILTNICEDNRPPSPLGRKYSVEYRRRLSDSKKGAANPMYGKTISEETRKKISESNSGKNNHFYDKSHSPKTIQSMRDKARKRNKENYFGPKHGTESRKKIQQNNPNRKEVHTPYGIFTSAEEFTKIHKIISANALRKWLKDPDKIITRRNISRAKYILQDQYVGKSFRDIGYYYVII